MMENIEKKQDRRVLRTKKAIRNSFVKLLSEKEVDKITVKEIADGADVDRKTVYNYYGGVYEILDEIENELVDSFEKAIAEFDFPSRDRSEIFTALSDILQEHLETYSLLMKVGSSSRMASKIMVYLHEKVRIVLGRTRKEYPAKLDLAVEYVTAGIFAAYRYWFNSDRKQSLREFTKEVERLVLGATTEYFKED